MSLPNVVRLAWGLRPAVRSGPKPAFTLPQIVAAAVRLADEGGLAGFSMNKLAVRLNSKTMTLYRYVEARDDLLALMLDTAYGPIPDHAPEPRPWRDALEFWARHLFAVLQQHPWMLDVRIGGLPQTPNALAWIDYGLRALGATDLDDVAQLNLLLLLDGHVRGTARLTSDLAHARSDGPDTPYVQVMRDLINTDRFPALAHMIETGALGVIDAPDNPDPAGFEFGLDRILGSIQ